MSNDAIRAIAADLGLGAAPDVSPVTVHGAVDGIALRVVQDSSEGFVDVVSFLPLPLDLGLRLTNLADAGEGPLIHQREAQSAASIGISIECDDSERLRSWNPVLAAMGGFDPMRVSLEVLDDRVHARLFAPRSDDVRRVAELVRCVERARDRMEMASLAAPHEEAWTRLAEEERWTLARVPLAVTGHDGDVGVLSWLGRRAADAFDLVVRLRYVLRIPDALTVVDRTAGPDGWMAQIREPIVVERKGVGAGLEGDAELDEASHAILSRLAVAGFVEMNAEGLDVRVPLPAAPELSVALVRDAVSVGRTAWQAARGGRSRGARSVYRAPGT